MIDQDNSRTADDYETGATSPRQRAIEAYEGARDRAADTLGEAPLLALAGGIAAGALIAARKSSVEISSAQLRTMRRLVSRTGYSASSMTNFSARSPGSSWRTTSLGATRFSARAATSAVTSLRNIS